MNAKDIKRAIKELKLPEKIEYACFIPWYGCLGYMDVPTAQALKGVGVFEYSDGTKRQYPIFKSKTKCGGLWCVRH